MELRTRGGFGKIVERHTAFRGNMWLITAPNKRSAVRGYYELIAYGDLQKLIYLDFGCLSHKTGIRF